MSKAVLTTGASSGMGREAAILLARAGHRVYAGARRMGRMVDLADHGVTAVEMDVTSAELDKHSGSSAYAAQIEPFIKSPGPQQAVAEDEGESVAYRLAD